jgi:photosystem II stability/assembly factor-like uncharacterized protein
MEELMRNLRAWRVILLGLALASVPGTTVASAGTFQLGPAVNASGPSPFLGCPFGLDPNNPSATAYANTEVEPFVAVNPTNHDNILGVYQQDRWTDGGSRGLIASRSFDGGTTWAQNFAEFSRCSDILATGYTSPFPRATDPWVSFDAAGKAYQISLGIVSAGGIFSGVEVATSSDGGSTWSLPKRLITDNDPIFFNDKESITGDPNQAGRAYATWIRGNLPGWDNISIVGASHSFAFRGLPMFSRTTDGGATWSAPVPMVNSNIYAQGNQIAVLPDGTLVDIYGALFKGAGNQPSNQAFWGAVRSTNGGKTWGGPIKIAELNTALLTNPDIPNPTSLDQTVRADDYLPDVAVDPNDGTLYMVFADSISTGFDHVKLTKSTNGGKTWTTPTDVTKTPSSTHSFNGTVEVTADGTVAVLYYDFRNNTPAPGLPTNVWLTHSHDGGATWSEQQVLPDPFDMENAPIARGWFLGDYQGLAAVGNDLMLFFSVATGANDSADVLAVRANHS